MRGERAGRQMLQTTVLVNEVYLRLVDCRHVEWQHRTQFFALSAQLMRRILVDAARARGARKRGGSARHVTLDASAIASPDRAIDLLALDEALTRLSAMDPRKGRVVELRYFGGLSVKETAEALTVSPETVMRDWKMAKLWLLRELKR
jgi:RNA polymerase sigma-70 factor (ECF subfamily)